MKFRDFKLLFFYQVFLLVLFVSCSRVHRNSTIITNGNPAEAHMVQRGGEARVFRSVLDLKPRMLSIALHDKLWLAYNTQTASLYKAWNGIINFEGAVYTSTHGPQPTSEGMTYLQEPDVLSWRIVTAEGNEIMPEVIYKGHRIRNNQVTLLYKLVYDRHTIHIAEKPAVRSSNGSQICLERTFETSGVPAGAKVLLHMHPGSMLNENDYKTNGEFSVSDKSVEDVDNKKYYSLAGRLQLISNGKCSFEINLATRPAVSHKDTRVLTNEEVVLSLMAKSDCNTCHNKEVKTIGPAYAAISAKYKNKPQVKEILVKKIINGGAGVWGEIPMTPHPNLSLADAGKIVSYILALDAGKDEEKPLVQRSTAPEFTFKLKALDPAKANIKAENPGIAVNVYQFETKVYGFPEIDKNILPNFSGVVNILNAQAVDFGGFQNNFVINASGYMKIDKSSKMVFRLVADDGARLFINEKLVIENGGNINGEPRDGEVFLKAGKHPFKIQYFQRSGGKRLSLQWRPYGLDTFKVVPPEAFTFNGADIKRTQNEMLSKVFSPTPGDASPLPGVHPSFNLAQGRPENFKPKVGGMDFLPDGRLVVSTWDSLGAVYILEGTQGNNPENIKVKQIAFGLAEPLGLKVVDGEIYVLQKHELTKLVDVDKDDMIDEYLTVCNAWKVSANFHEFAFGLVYKEGYFYGTLATAINPGGASTKVQIQDRGKVVKISKKDGTLTFVANGLRTPNGIGLGIDNQIFIADNQGDWLPSNKIIHLQENAWYGSRSVDFAGTENLIESPPVVWLAQDEIGNSPSQPTFLNIGPYQNQMIHGDVTHGGIKRVFLEKVNGNYQGAVFRFTQGLEAGVNRLVWGPDNALYIGGIGSTGNWGHAGKLSYGLQKLTYNNKLTFEILAVRAKSNGMEIEFTEALQAGAGQKATDYAVRQWYYKPTSSYGGPKLNERNLRIITANVSADRKKVFLELEGMSPNHVIYFRLNKDTITSSTGQSLWSTEAWYTLNNIPKDPGKLSVK